ncbi:MAG TPA: hypothetical protein VHL14_02180 [Steroidobacteraceae bacterium]|nr:hypothetical protein [Steroidobacteraceae bacterium]
MRSSHKVVAIERCAKDGSAKFKPRCDLPLTGANVVDMLITYLAFFSRPNRQSGLELIEIATAVTQGEVAARTTATYSIKV